MRFQAQSGSLRLRAASIGGETVLAEVFRKAPYHPSPLHRRDVMPEVVLQGVGPGMLPGDRLMVEITVDDGAALAVTGQGASKIYSAPMHERVECRTDLTVGRDGVLWWLPGELIPFRDAELLALTSVRLESSAKFAYLDILTPGRKAMGEVNAFRRLELRLRIDVAGLPRLAERSVIDPRTRRVNTIGRHGAALCTGTLVLVGYPCPSLGGTDHADCWLGIDGDERLTVARGFADSATMLRGALLDLLHTAAHGSGAAP